MNAFYILFNCQGYLSICEIYIQQYLQYHAECILCRDIYKLNGIYIYMLIAIFLAVHFTEFFATSIDNILTTAIFLTALYILSNLDICDATCNYPTRAQGGACTPPKGYDTTNLLKHIQSRITKGCALVARQTDHHPTRIVMGETFE